MADRITKKTDKPYQTGMSNRIRAAAVKLCRFSRRRLLYEVDASEKDRSFDNAWDALRRRGEIVRFKNGKYQYIARFKPRANVRQRIFRAMHIKGAFCASDIKKLTDAEPSYILNVARLLVRDEWLEFTGKNGKHKIFRVKHKDLFYQEFVRGNH